METYGVELVIASSEPNTSKQLVVANQRNMISGEYIQLLYSAPGGPAVLLGENGDDGRLRLDPELTRSIYANHQSNFRALKLARPDSVPSIRRIWLVWQHESIFHPISRGMSFDEYILFANNSEERVMRNFRRMIEAYELRRLGRPKVQTLVLPNK